MTELKQSFATAHNKPMESEMRSVSLGSQAPAKGVENAGGSNLSFIDRFAKGIFEGPMLGRIGNVAVMAITIAGVVAAGQAVLGKTGYTVTTDHSKMCQDIHGNKAQMFSYVTKDGMPMVMYDASPRGSADAAQILNGTAVDGQYQGQTIDQMWAQVSKDCGSMFTVGGPFAKIIPTAKVSPPLDYAMQHQGSSPVPINGM